MPSEQERADQLLDEALEASGARDPREFYRRRLRELKQSDQDKYGQAVAYYTDTLVPSIASGEAEPLPAWTEYGVTLATLAAPGRTVELDETGKARPYEPPGDPERLILHMPDRKNVTAMVVALPRELSDAQRAAYDWLVAGRRRME